MARVRFLSLEHTICSPLTSVKYTSHRRAYLNILMCEARKQVGSPFREASLSSNRAGRLRAPYLFSMQHQVALLDLRGTSLSPWLNQTTWVGKGGKVDVHLYLHLMRTFSREYARDEIPKAANE